MPKERNGKKIKINVLIIILRIYDMNARMVDYGSKLLAIGDRDKMQIRNYVFVDRSELIITI